MLWHRQMRKTKRRLSRIVADFLIAQVLLCVSTAISAEPFLKKTNILESGISGYSDLTVGQDGTIYCFYERGTVDGSYYRPKSLAVARFNIEWLTDDEDELRLAGHKAVLGE